MIKFGDNASYSYFNSGLLFQDHSLYVSITVIKLKLSRKG